MLDKLEFIIPLLISRFQFDTNDEKILSGTREPAKRVVIALLNLRPARQQLTEQDEKKIERILKECADKLEALEYSNHSDINQLPAVQYCLF